MNYQVVSYSSVGPIRLGMTLHEVRSALGGEFYSFTKGEDPPLPIESFRSGTVHVYHDTSGVTVAVELFGPANPLLEGKKLIGQPFSEILKWFTERDPDLQVDGSGLTSPKYGVGLYAPAALKEPNEPIEAVIVFRRGYYDQLGIMTS